MARENEEGTDRNNVFVPGLIVVKKGDEESRQRWRFRGVDGHEVEGSGPATDHLGPRVSRQELCFVSVLTLNQSLGKFSLDQNSPNHLKWSGALVQFLVSPTLR